MKLASACRLLPPPGRTAPVCELQGLVHRLFERARIVGVDEPGIERHRFRRNHVFSTQFHRTDVEFSGRYIDDPLDTITCLWTPGAAVGARRMRIAENASDFDVEVADCIRSGKTAEIVGWAVKAEAIYISADVGSGLH